MLAGAGLLAVLDGTILSASPSTTRALLALAVTLIVGGFILAVWRSNSKLEKAADGGRSQSGEKPPPGGSKDKPQVR